MQTFLIDRTATPVGELVLMPMNRGACGRLTGPITKRA